MTEPTAPQGSKPTHKQLRYLKQLAEQRGQSFTYPTTKAEASREIDRLRGIQKTAAADVRRERLEVSRDMAVRRGDQARVRDSEVSGYGSSATWARFGGEEER